MKHERVHHRRQAGALAVLLALTLLLPLMPRAAAQPPVITELDQLAGQEVAVTLGTVTAEVVLARVPDAIPAYYNDAAAQAMAVINGQATALVNDEPIVKLLLLQNPGMRILDEWVSADSYAIAMNKADTELCGQLDALIVGYWADGTMDALKEKWVEGPMEGKTMPDYSCAGSSGTLRLATCSTVEPFCYIGANGAFMGYDIELISMLARDLDKKLEISNMEFGSMIPAVLAGKADIASAGTTHTEERAKQVLFSEAVYKGGMVAAVLDDPNAALAPESFQKIDDLGGKKVGILTGSTQDQILLARLPDAQPVYYNNVGDLAAALTSQQISGILMDKVIARSIAEKNKGFRVLDEWVEQNQVAFAFSKEREALRTQVNEVLARLKADGTMDAFEKKWMEGPAEGRIMPDYSCQGKNGVLRFATNAALEPFTYSGFNGQIVGYDIELISMVARELDMTLEISNMDFGALIPGLVSGKYDCAGASIIVTEERAKQVLFSDSVFDGGMVIIVSDGAAEGGGFFAALKESIYNNLIFENRYLLILDGLKATILISLLAAVVGTALGFVFCLMRISKSRVLRGLSGVIVGALRGTPAVVLLMLVCFGILAKVNHPILIATVAFGFNFGAYVSEILHSGIRSVDPGQLEAAQALGFGLVQVFAQITLPQAVRQALPVYRGEFISMVKMTSVAGYVAIQDLTRAVDIIRGRTFEAYFPLILTALIYITLTWLLTRALTLLEKRLDPKTRKREVRV